MDIRFQNIPASEDLPGPHVIMTQDEFRGVCDILARTQKMLWHLNLIAQFPRPSKKKDPNGIAAWMIAKATEGVTVDVEAKPDA